MVDSMTFIFRKRTNIHFGLIDSNLFRLFSCHCHNGSPVPVSMNSPNGNRRLSKTKHDDTHKSECGTMRTTNDFQAYAFTN